MFAAAAVAAAAALTAISTTSTANETLSQQKTNYNTKESSLNHLQTQISHSPRPYISWTQYASQRRSSLQRRKIEISKRLEKATNAANNRNLNLQQSQAQQKQKSSSDKLTQSSSTNTKKEQMYLNNLNQLETNDFDLITNLQSELNIQDGAINMNEISNALLDYLQVNNIAYNNDNIIEENSTSSYQTGKSYLLKQETIKKKREEKLNYIITHRWDPKWLKLIRSRICIPFAFLTLIFFIFTNFSANWIKIYEKDHIQRVGLWFICNRSIEINIISNNNNNFDKPEFNLNLNNEQNETEISTFAIIDNNLNNINLNKKKSLINKFNRVKNNILYNKKRDDEDCYSKFFFKEDAHLAVLSLSIIGILFHAIGLVLLFFGLFSTLSDRTLYFYHSAGECLITSAIVNLLDLLAFISVVSSQIEQTNKYGYCLFINCFVSLITFICSIILYLDDIVNGYKIWKIKNQSFYNLKAKNTF